MSFIAQRFLLRLAVALTLAVASWATTAQARDSGLLERGNGPEPDTLDAQRAQTIAAFNVLRDLYEGLVVEDAVGAIVPGLAESWSVSPDGLSWTFVLREDLRWSDGSALSAQEYVASFRRALDPATAAPYANSLAAIREAPAILAGRERPEALGVTALDGRTLRIELSHPTALLKRLTLPIAFPVNLRQIERFGDKHARPGQLLGSGAYRLRDWTVQSSLTLERNPNYHAVAQVAIAAVRYQVTEDAASEEKRFLSGDLDLTETVPPGRLDRLRERHGDALKIAPYLGVFYFGLNLRQPPFRAAAQLREALALALDRDTLTRYVTGLGEQPAYGLVPPGIGDYAADPPDWSRWSAEQRLTRAAELYAGAGYGPQHPLEVELRYNTSTQHRKLALAVAAMWKQALGVRSHLVNEEWKVFVLHRRQGTTTQVFRGGWIADFDDALSFLEPFVSGQGLNSTGFSDSAFDALLDQANREAAPLQRAHLLQSAERQLLSAHAIVPIYFYTSKHLVGARVEGWIGNPLDHHPTRFLRLRPALP